MNSGAAMAGGHERSASPSADLEAIAMEQEAPDDFVRPLVALRERHGKQGTVDRKAVKPRREIRKILTLQRACAGAPVCSSLRRCAAIFVLDRSDQEKTVERSMRKSRRVWVKVLSREEKAAIAAECDRLITQVLKPRFLPEIRPTQFNYPVDIFGKWRGSKYSFIQRYRSGFPENLGEEFDVPFSRLDHAAACLSATCFDVMWHRHTGRWRRLYSGVTLEEALRLIETEELLHPN
jgi:hypothetical protein